MAVYNGKDFLRPAIDSILNQTHRNLEFIIINDASIDETTDILKSYTDPRLIVITNTENLGLTKSLNKALQLAKGQFIARQDADDISHPDRLATQFTFLCENPEYALVGCSARLIDEHGNLITDIKVLSESKQIESSLANNNQFIHGSILAYKSAITSAGGYRENFRCTQDYDLWLRMSEAYTLTNLPDVLYSLRRVSNSISMINFDRQLAFAFLAREFYDERKQFGTDSHFELDPKHPEELINRKFQHLLAKLEQEKYYLCLAYADESKILNKHKIARSWLKKAIKSAPTLQHRWKAQKILWVDFLSPLSSAYQRHIGWRFRR